MSSLDPLVVILGLDSITGLQSARVLAARGLGVVGVAASREHPSCRTNVCRRIVFGPLSGAGLIEQLESMRGTFDQPPVLLPCTDLSVLALSQHRGALAASYRMVLPKPGVIELLLDKASFQSYAHEHGLPIARSMTVREPADAERAASELTMPCVLKPAVKTPSWHAHTTAKVFRVTTPQALLEQYRRCRQWTDTLIAQEWIDGPDSAHVTCNAYFDADSRAHVTYVSEKVRQWPHEGGVGCLSRSVINDEVREATVRVFGQLAHRGLAYLEMKRDPRSGRCLIIEPNVGRPTGRSAAADAAGVELLYSHYCDAAGRPLPPSRPQPARSTAWIYLRQDVQSAVRHWRNGNLTAAGWVRSLQQCRVDAVFSWSDPRPFFADIRVGLRKATRSADRITPCDVDFDIHGIVGLRLIDATPSDVGVITRQLGPFQRPLARDPDLTIRFVDRVPTGTLRWIEYGTSGFCGDEFFILQSGKRPTAITYPLHRLADGMEIVCQHGARSIPHLITLITLLASERGCVPIHGSAFYYQGVGVLVTGWAKGGKTEALLAFTQQGAEYVGDEWILLMPDGRMAGLPEHIRLQDWHLAQMPVLRSSVPPATRAWFYSVRALERTHRAMVRTPLRHLWPHGPVNDALPALRRQLNVQMNPARVFERQSTFLRHCDVVFFMTSHDSSTVSTTPITAAEVADRMCASVDQERLPLLATWHAHRFAFPQRANALLDRAQQGQRDALTRCLAGRPAYEVRHPYPCVLSELFDVMVPVLPGAGRRIDFMRAADAVSQETLP